MTEFDLLLTQLLDRLDAIGEEYEEIGDSAVRDQISAVIHHRFILLKENYPIPDSLGMFSETANRLAKEALLGFLKTAPTTAAAQGFESADSRLSAFQNENVASGDGSYYDDYFGYTESV